MYYQRYSNTGGFWGILFLFLLIFGGFRTVFLLFGVLVALVINFFPLLIVGYVVYRFVQRAGKNRWVNASLNTESADYKRFVEIMVHILIHVAKADGTVDAKETGVIRQFFITQMNFSDGKITWLNDIIQSAMTNSESLVALAGECSRQFGYESRLMLLNMVYNVAFVDGEFHSKEAAMIDQLAVLLKISAFDHQRIKMAFEAQFASSSVDSESAYYACLGLKKGASKDEIKKAYRSLTKKYHPDKVQHLGQDFRVQAEKKMQEINRAYDEIMKRVPA